MLLLRLSLTIAIVPMPAVAAAQAQVPARVDLARYIQASYSGIKANLLAAAQAMPETDYAFKPTAMPQARNFAAVIAHAADGMFATCARASAVATPSPDVEKRLTTKPDVVAALADSIRFCDPVFASLTAVTAEDYVPQGPVQIPRSAALMGLLAHNAEMFGISTVYLRARNIVPPGSQ